MVPMTPERWKRVEPLFHAARNRPVGERAAFLLDACGGDETLRREVEALVSEPVSADGGLLDGSALGAGPGLVAAALDAALTGRMTGRSLGGYDVQAVLGAGGMGEVYRAHDSKLGRDVAVKILPQAFTSHPDRLARLEREARILAALNHPNICVIYGLEEAESIRFLILELVEGETLAEKLADTSRRHAQGASLPVAETLTLVRQIAEALEFAHEKGIIHRDLKPANIKVTRDGVVKLLDFGLAKAVAGEATTGDLTAVPTESDSGVREGAVLGTAAYMSPEQACGKPVDRRTDIWAFGVVLFEMLTGRRPFVGDSTSETLASVLKTEPDWRELPAAVPADLGRLLRRCLTKDPKRRVQSIADVRAQIDDLVIDRPEEPPVPAPGAFPPRRWPAVLGALALALSLFAAVAVWLSSRTTSSSIDERLARATVMPFTDFDGANLDASLSPDGKFVSFLADHGGPFHIWLKRVGAGNIEDLTPGQPDQRNPGPLRSAGFSGDGSQIWINGSPSAHRRLQLMPMMGGAPSAFLAERAANVVWSADATRLVYFAADAGDPLYVADGTGGNEQLLYRGANGDHHHYPAWSTDGRWIYFTCAVQSVSEYRICRVPSSGHTDKPTYITESTNDVRYLTSVDARTMLFVSPDQDRSGPWLWALDLDRNMPHRVSSGLDLERYLSVAADTDGRRLVVTVARSTANLWSVPILDRLAEDADVTPYSMPTVRALAPRFAGAAIFFLASSGQGDGLWSLQGAGPPVEIWKSSDGALLESPSVSPLGDRVAVVTRKQAKLHISLVRADGSAHNSLAEGIDVRGASAWSPKADWIVTGGIDDHVPVLFKIKVDDGTYTRLVMGQALNPAWSPDGQVIVYEGQQAANALLLAVHPDGTAVSNFPKIVVPAGGRGRSRFLSDGRLVYMQGLTGTQDFFQLDLATYKIRQIAHLLSPATVNTFDVTPDGKRIVFDRVREQSEIRLIDLPKQ